MKVKEKNRADVHRLWDTFDVAVVNKTCRYKLMCYECLLIVFWVQHKEIIKLINILNVLDRRNLYLVTQRQCVQITTLHELP